MEEDTRKWIWWGIPTLIAVGVLAAFYYHRKHQEEPPVQQVRSAPVPPVAPARPDYPIPPEATNAQPLPVLADSDAAVKDSLTGVFGRSLDEFLVPTDIVRHIVVTVDNLMRRKASVQMWPLQPTPGQPVVAGADEQLTLSEDNFARYEPIMKMVRSTDVRQVAAVYKHFYPLFQQVYADLGYPNGYFNNRLVEVIDNLLETPEVHGPIRLVQPGVLYQFADPALEDRSAGQKLLIRMGSNNAAIIKTKLRELRSEIAR
ncbi:MAG: DUF3014 domain-containing protein [Proteobacteria bacterium]|nr:DUF3014 domain-containing protein [Pseudomonadota bacterium]